VSERILNGTSAQFGYTVPFTSLHAGKDWIEDKSETQTTKLKKTLIQIPFPIALSK